jgi:TolB-like protein
MDVMPEPEPQGDACLVGRSLGAYRILQALGSGGMGEVYLAEDTRLERRVALKVLPPEMAAHPDKIERFEREARAVASLSHPGIVVLHSIEEAEGIRFLTMEHVEGETLGKAIPAGGFPVERFLPLAITLTDAVSTAHQQGILHRDLKPDNVMLTAGDRLKVLDFGLAKLLADAPPDPDGSSRETKSVTQDGRIVGTVAYMSPEQAQGLPVDHRSDVFSLGILLYEMVSGERPFKGHTNLSVLSSILKDTPRPVSQIREDVPKALARMIQRALEKRPEDRYQSAADLRRDLEDLKRDVESGELRLATTQGRALAMAAPSRPRRRWLPVAVAAGAVALALSAYFVRRDRHPALMESDGRRSLAVFYFDNLSGDPKLDWLRTGLTDMMVTGLSQSATLRVVSTTRLYQILDELGHRDDAANSAQVVASVARRADVATALVGSFVRAGSQLRIQAQLQDPQSGEVLASERVEGNADDGLFALVDELTSRIRGRLEAAPVAKGGDKKLEEVTTSSLDAYRLYAEGMRLHDRLQEHEAQALFEKSVAADPGFASALAKLSVVHANLGDKQKAREYAGRALERSEKLPAGERHYIEGRYYSLDPTTSAKAIAAYQAAVDATPDHSAARNNLAQLLLGARRYSEALLHLEELRPPVRTRRRRRCCAPTWPSTRTAAPATRTSPPCWCRVAASRRLSRPAIEPSSSTPAATWPRKHGWPSTCCARSGIGRRPAPRRSWFPPTRCCASREARAWFGSSSIAGISPPPAS